MRDKGLPGDEEKGRRGEERLGRSHPSPLIPHPSRRSAAEERYSVWTTQSWSHDDLDKVLGQVNDLKHRHGVFYRRTVKYS